MASLKAIVAIAVTLIVAVPILMGYGFATEDVTTTDYEVTSTVNATDLLLNSEGYYTTEFMNPYNNKELISNSSGALSLLAPNYVTYSSTYTSLPTYSTTTGTVTLDSSTSTEYSLENTIGTSGSGADVSVTAYPLVELSFERPSGVTGVWCYVYESSSLIDDYYSLSYCTGRLAYDSSSTWQSWPSPNYDDETYTGWSTWYVEGMSSGTLTVTTRDYTQIDPGSNDILFYTSDFAAVKIVTSSSTYYLPINTATSVLMTSSGTVTIGGTDVYDNVTGFYIAEQSSVTSIEYEYTGATSNGYADPADGWSRPGTTAEVWWMNGQKNQSVRFLVDLSDGSGVGLGPSSSMISSTLVHLEYTDGIMYVTDYNGTTTELGGYSRAMLEVNTDGATVYGITEWPTVGIYPTTFNSVEVEYTEVTSISYIRIMGDGNFRVDSAEIVAGSFPTTENVWIYFNELYPETSLALTFKSIATYGDWLTFGEDGTDYNNRGETTITFTDTDGTSHTEKLKGLTVKMIYDSDAATYTTYLNDIQVNTTGDGSVYFGGEWVLTASLSTLAETTTTTQTWAAGEFAFEKEDYAACGMLVAGICLVGLGMTGPRSGTKIGVLLMICGGAGLIYLNLI